MSEGKNITCLGQYYTPSEVAQTLTDWAILDANARILDPSYGGCSFLNAALTTLTEKDCLLPARQVFGVDIDHQSAKYLKTLFDAGASPTQYLRKDFFETDINDFGGIRFDAVVGNPPYVRYHNIPEQLQKLAELRLAQYGMKISGRASYWAFFLLYSIRFLRPGGRLAMLLPGAFLHTDYSAKVRELMISHFERVKIHLLQERIFEGTQEETVIVCAEGAGLPNKSVQVNQTSTIVELRQSLKNGHNHTHVAGDESGDGGWLRACLDKGALEIYDELIGNPNVIRLGDWVDTRIGVVTGCNKYFILSPNKREYLGIPEEYFVPLIRRPAYLSGLAVTNRDLKVLEKQDKNYLLLNPPEKRWRMAAALRRYIEQGEEKGVNDAYKCKSRTPWYIVPQTYAPAAFVPCMAATWARLVVNRSNYTCTNNIIRLTWKEKRPDMDWIRLAIGTLSTFSQMSAELVGRSYGGGVLKLEPTELTRWAVPLIPTEITQQLARQIDKLLRQGNFIAATEAVDEALASTIRRLSSRNVKKLRTARDQLLMRRRHHRCDASKITERS
jgi:adenine-specific DNA-methyltransferase